MEQPLTRIFDNLLARIEEPQPLVVTFFATRDGMKDAHEQEPPDFWSLFTDVAHRRVLRPGGWKSLGKALILAIVPYGIVRGPANRLTPCPRREVRYGYRER